VIRPFDARRVVLKHRRVVTLRQTHTAQQVADSMRRYIVSMAIPDAE
jgi:hypothetical protein